MIEVITAALIYTFFRTQNFALHLEIFLHNEYGMI